VDNRCYGLASSITSSTRSSIAFVLARRRFAASSSLIFLSSPSLLPLAQQRPLWKNDVLFPSVQDGHYCPCGSEEGLEERPQLPCASPQLFPAAVGVGQHWSHLLLYVWRPLDCLLRQLMQCRLERICVFISTVGALAIVAFFGCPRALRGFSNSEFRSIVVSSWILILSPRFGTGFGLARVLACVSHVDACRLWKGLMLCVEVVRGRSTG